MAAGNKNIPFKFQHCNRNQKSLKVFDRDRDRGEHSQSSRKQIFQLRTFVQSKFPAKGQSAAHVLIISKIKILDQLNQSRSRIGTLGSPQIIKVNFSEAIQKLLY